MSTQIRTQPHRVPRRGVQTGILAFVVLIGALATLPFNAGFVMPVLGAITLTKVDPRLRLLVVILSILMIVLGILMAWDAQSN